MGSWRKGQGSLCRKGGGRSGRTWFWPLLVTLCAVPVCARLGPGLMRGPGEWQISYRAVLGRLETVVGVGAGRVALWAFSGVGGREPVTVGEEKLDLDAAAMGEPSPASALSLAVCGFVPRAHLVTRSV